MRWNLFRSKELIPFSEDHEMQTLQAEAEEFYRNILEEGDEPAFVSDEANVFDISSSTADYLVDRCMTFYKVNITKAELSVPFPRLLRRLNQSRQTSL